MKLITEIKNNDGTTTTNVLTDVEVELEALCAYRDQLIMSDDYEKIEVRDKLIMLNQVIFDVRDRIPVG